MLSRYGRRHRETLSNGGSRPGSNASCGISRLSSISKGITTIRKARRKNQDGSNHRHLRKKINGAGLMIMIILASAKQRVIRRTFRILSVSLSFYTIGVIQYQCFGKSPVFSAYAHSFRVYLHILRNFVCGLTLVPKWMSTGPMKDFLKAPPYSTTFL
jgi:hypothetical protein